MSGLAQRQSRADPSVWIAAQAVQSLHLEVDSFPKPGLVSHIDNGAHRDMDAELLHRSAESLAPFFVDLAAAGAECAEMGRLRAIGIAAEQAMLAETKGVNTHRGAIFGLGLLVAAAGFRSRVEARAPLGRIVADRWGAAILGGPIALHSHGAKAARRYRVGGARAEAAAGFPALYQVGLPAYIDGLRLAAGALEDARVQACFALIAKLDDTNLLHRGGQEGLDFARTQAASFIDRGGIAMPGWRAEAAAVHAEFTGRNLSPGGSADLLAMSLFAYACGDRAP